MRASEIVVRAPGKRLAPEALAEIQSNVAARLPKELGAYSMKQLQVAAETGVRSSGTAQARKRKVEVEVSVTLKPPTITITIRW